MVLSDHHPITLTLHSPKLISRSKICRRKPSLSKDKANVDKLWAILQEFFVINDTPDVNSLWEAQKCDIRAEFLSLSATAKKTQQALVHSLLTCICSLETIQKCTNAVAAFQDQMAATPGGIRQKN